MFILESNATGDQYYMPDGADFDRSKYSVVQSSIEEKGPPQDQVSGTVPSSNIPSWINDALGKVGLQMQSPQFGTGAITQGMDTLLEPGTIGNVAQGIKESVGPGVGGVTGSTIGGIGAGLLAGPEAVPWGVYLGGVGGAGIGQAVQSLAETGSVDPQKAAIMASINAILGPIGAGGMAAVKGVGRSIPGISKMMGDPLETAVVNNPGVTINTGRLMNTLVKAQQGTKSLLPTVEKNTSQTLQNLESEIANNSVGGYDMNPYAADRIRQLVGDLQKSPDLQNTGLADPLYRSMMEDLRAQGWSGGNVPARAILEKIAENKGKDALMSGMNKLPLMAGTGTGFLALRYLNSLPKAVLAGLLPPTAVGMGQLFKLGLYDAPSAIPYGLLPPMMNAGYNALTGGE